MQPDNIGGLVRDAFVVVLKLGGPPLLAALVVGLLVSVVQTVTQINEQTLSFVPKVAAVAALLFLLGSYMLSSLGDFTRMLFDQIVAVGGS